MNRALKMLEVLSDGQRHSRRDLFERCGFFLTNNAASELRAMDYDVEQTRERVNGDVVYFYRLRGSLPEGGVGDKAVTGSAFPREDAPEPYPGSSLPVRPSENEQLVASSPTPPLSDTSLLPMDEDDGKHDHAHVGRGGAEEESEQPSLFTLQRSVPWA